jgi:carboxymethylenebutenolidase
MGSEIAFTGDGGELRGYLARAETAHASPDVGAPGVIVLQEWWGLVDHVKDVCDRLAAAGFHALAPDLYAGRSTTKPDEAGKLMMALDIAATERALRGAVARLRAEPGVAGDKVGVIGFCMGGQLALFAAAANPGIGACVDFYGIHPSVSVDFAKLEAPVLGFFAEHDAFVDGRAVAALVSALAEAGKRFEIHRYLDARHAFFNDSRPEVYHPGHAADAWQKTLAFFRSHL